MIRVTSSTYTGKRYNRLLQMNKVMFVITVFTSLLKTRSSDPCIINQSTARDTKLISIFKLYNFAATFDYGKKLSNTVCIYFNLFVFTKPLRGSHNVPHGSTCIKTLAISISIAILGSYHSFWDNRNLILSK